MNNSRLLLSNIIIVLAVSILASGILFLAGERGWLKYVAWFIFFAVSQSSIFFVGNSKARCSLLARLKR